MEATGTTNWSFTLAPAPEDGGPYTVYIKAVDVNENESNIVSRSFTYVVLEPLGVAVFGPGTVTPGFQGVSQREIRRSLHDHCNTLEWGRIRELDGRHNIGLLHPDFYDDRRPATSGEFCGEELNVLILLASSVTDVAAGASVS